MAWKYLASHPEKVSKEFLALPGESLFHGRIFGNGDGRQLSRRERSTTRSVLVIDQGVLNAGRFVVDCQFSTPMVNKLGPSKS